MTKRRGLTKRRRLGRSAKRRGLTKGGWLCCRAKGGWLSDRSKRRRLRSKSGWCSKSTGLGRSTKGRGRRLRRGSKRGCARRSRAKRWHGRLQSLLVLLPVGYRLLQSILRMRTRILVHLLRPEHLCLYMLQIGCLLSALLCLVRQDTIFIWTHIHTFNQIRLTARRRIARQMPYRTALRTHIRTNALLGQHNLRLRRTCRLGFRSKRRECRRLAKRTSSCLSRMLISAVAAEAASPLQEKLAHYHAVGRETCGAWRSFLGGWELCLYKATVPRRTNGRPRPLSSVRARSVARRPRWFVTQSTWNP